MNAWIRELPLATAILALPLAAFARPSTTSAQAASALTEAAQMVPAQAALVRNVNAKDLHAGSTFQARLSDTAVLDNGTRLPSGTLLIGHVVQDSTPAAGPARLAVQFTKAELKHGKTVPVKATIVGIYGPASVNEEGYPVAPGNQVPNLWTKGTTSVDETGAISGVDLHSNIENKDSGVFIATSKDNVKLRAGSEIQFALAPAGSGQTGSSGPSTRA